MTLLPSLLSRRAAERKAARTATAPAPPPVQDQTAKLAAIRSDAQRRAAAAWTAAKNLLPTASPKAQMHLATALVTAPTEILAETLRSVARLSHYTKSAEKFEAKTKTSLNEFVDDESMLSKLMTEVLSENKADVPKTAAKPKTADEPTVEDPPPPKDPTADAPKGDFTEPAPAGDAAVGGMGAGVDAPAPANAVGDQVAEGSLLSKIDTAEQQISDIESEVEEAGEEALDLAAIFNPEVQADKAQNLANEGEGADIPADEMEGVDFGPSSTDDMQDAADFGGDVGTTEPDYFKGASGPDDPMAFLLGGEKTAAAEGVDVPMGDMAKHFETDLAGDDRDAESDVEDLFGEVLVALDQPTMKQKRDTEPHFEEPPAPQTPDKKASAPPAPQAAAPAKKSSITTVGVPVSTLKTASCEDIARLIFNDEDDDVKPVQSKLKPRK